jgi:hypothetical protein
MRMDITCRSGIIARLLAQDDWDVAQSKDFQRIRKTKSD